MRDDFMSGLGENAWLLYGLVRAIRPEVSVEIGSARGKSACYMGMALRENGSGKLYAIDPHCKTDWNDGGPVETLEIMAGNIKRFGLEDYVEIIRATSKEAAGSWKLPIDILFIDGNHSYEGVSSDWMLYSRFLSPFGIAIFHDTMWELQGNPSPDMGVPKFVEDLRRQGYPVITLDRDFGITIIQPVVGGIPLCKGKE